MGVGISSFTGQHRTVRYLRSSLNNDMDAPSILVTPRRLSSPYPRIALQSRSFFELDTSSSHAFLDKVLGLSAPTAFAFHQTLASTQPSPDVYNITTCRNGICHQRSMVSTFPPSSTPLAIHPQYIPAESVTFQMPKKYYRCQIRYYSGRHMFTADDK